MERPSGTKERLREQSGPRPPERAKRNQRWCRDKGTFSVQTENLLAWNAPALGKPRHWDSSYAEISLFGWIGRYGRQSGGPASWAEKRCSTKLSFAAISSDDPVDLIVTDPLVLDRGDPLPGKKQLLWAFLRSQTKLHASVIQPDFAIRHGQPLLPKPGAHPAGSTCTEGPSQRIPRSGQSEAAEWKSAEKAISAIHKAIKMAKTLPTSVTQSGTCCCAPPPALRA